MSSTVSLSSTFGLTRDGFIRQRLLDISQSIANDLNARTGINFDTEPDSLTGQFISIFAEREAILWEQLEATYLAMYPSTAEGDSLDEAVSFSGVIRLPSLRGQVIGQLFGSEGTLVSAGAVATLASDSRKTFRLFTSVTISRFNASDVQYFVSSTAPRLDIAGVAYAAAAGQLTPQAAATSLASVINTNPRLFAISVGTNILIQTADSAALYFSGEVGLTLSSLGSPGLFRSDDAKAFPIVPIDLTVISTQTLGWQSLTNRLPGTSGRERENDEGLRQRYRLGVFRLGAATPQSLRANLEAIPGVTLVRVYDNKGDFTDAEGRPPHSFEAIVIGGDPKEIARTIHENAPAGIPSFGTNSYNFVDENGLIRLIQYTIPIDRFIWFKLTITGTPEEILPLDYVNRITMAAEAYGSKLQSGDNLYMDRVLSSIANIRGVASVLVEAGIGTATASPGVYSPADIAINARDRASISATRMLVVGP